MCWSVKCEGAAKALRPALAIHEIHLKSGHTKQVGAVLCTAPVVLCSIFAKYEHIPLLGYLGEPLLLGVEEAREPWS